MRPAEPPAELEGWALRADGSGGLFTRIHHPFHTGWTPRSPGEGFCRRTRNAFHVFLSFGRLRRWLLGAKATEIFPGSCECSILSRQQWLQCPALQSGDRGLGLRGEASRFFVEERGARQIRPLPAGPRPSLALLLAARAAEWPAPSREWPRPRLRTPALPIPVAVSLSRAAVCAAGPPHLVPASSSAPCAPPGATGCGLASGTRRGR